MSPPADARSVSLVIPGRNAARTLARCLDAVVPLLGKEGLHEVLFVDDGSSDDTAALAASHPVRLIRGDGRGPGHARNLGWKAAAGSLIWFIDSDCVAEPDALALLVRHFADASVGGAGGSYGNMSPGSLLACLIHEEILVRHRLMPPDVDYLATYNVVYRRDVLEQVGGFDEGLLNGRGSPGAEDVDLAFRVHELGYRLKFERGSAVKHYHPTRLGRYLRSQLHHGYWRVRLYLLHPKRVTGDSYSGTLDHLQPPLALLTVASLPLVFWPPLWIVPVALTALLLLAQGPMTARIVWRLGSPRYLWFAPLGAVRALWRGVGLAWGLCVGMGQRLVGPPPRPAETAQEEVRSGTRP